MSNPLVAFVTKPAVANFFNRAKRHAVGLCEDFWKDGTEDPFASLAGLKKKFLPAAKAPNGPTQLRMQSALNAATRGATGAGSGPQTAFWHAAPGEISEKMWGEGFMTPGGATISDMLIKPLGLTKSMDMLDLSAGLGGRMRRTSAEYGTYITGLEPDIEIATRGMELLKRAGKKQSSIAHYNPATFSADRSYDCIIAREIFYRVVDKENFIAALGACAKANAQIAFTDYIVNAEDREKPAIKAWRAHEKDASPMSLIESAEFWAKAGFHLRIHEDLSDFYKKEVTKGLKRLAATLASGPRPDADTKKAILRRIELWMHRLSAMEQGMKFYRFYGTKG